MPNESQPFPPKTSLGVDVIDGVFRVPIKVAVGGNKMEAVRKGGGHE